ncbi:MAG: hypothetical protein WAW37_20130 [Syntrophobacteraceae bacterium]
MPDTTETIRTYREMLKLDPTSSIFEHLAEELCALGRWEEVEQVCREGLRYHADHMRPRVLLGLALMEMGEPGEAGRILTEIDAEIRKNSIIFKLLSEFATLSGDHQRAMEFSTIYEAFHGHIPRGTCDEESLAARPAPGIEPESPSRPPGRLEMILSGLAERIESRLAGAGTPAGVLSASDSDLLKRAILADIT